MHMKIINRKAYFDYDILDRFEAGIHLAGSEVKSLRMGNAQLAGSYVKVIGSELYLVGAEIFPYKYARPEGYDPARTRKLLLHKKEILSLAGRIEGANLTLVQLSWYTKGSLVKLEVGLARGKKQYEKREIKKRRDQRRELEVEFRGKIK